MTPLPSSEVVGLPASEDKTFFRGTPDDKLGPGNRFQLQAKFATGKNSSIWLAKDSQLGRHVLLKILSGNASDSDSRCELLVYRHLATFPAEKSQHCSRLITHFTHRSPDGEHLCLALELEWTNLESVLSAKEPAFYPISIVKRILRHVLQGIVALQQIGIAHADIKPDNILVSLAPTWSDDKVSEWVSDHPPRLSDHSDTRDPLAFISEGFPRPTVEELGTCQFKIGGFSKGESLFRPNNPSLGNPIARDLLGGTMNDTIPLGLRPPEVILGYGWGDAVDIWMFGCLVFTTLTKIQLYPDDDPHWYYSAGLLPVECGVDPDDENLNIEFQLYKLTMEKRRCLDMLAQSRYSDKYFKPNSIDLKHIKYSCNTNGLFIEKCLRETEQFPMTWKDVTAAADFMRRCLKFHPNDRPSARELLKDPWLQDADV